MELQQLAEIMKQEDRLDCLESHWQELDWKLKGTQENLSEEILPNGIYDIYNPTVRAKYEERAKTFKVTNHFDETYVIKKSDLEVGAVRRLNLHVELGRVRKARLEKEREFLQQEIERVENSIKEFHFNEFLYGVSSDNHTIELYERMNPNRHNANGMDSHQICVNWLKDGF